MLTYTVQLEPQTEGGFTVTVPALPGCISEGDTLNEALQNIKDAIEGYIKVLAKHSRPIPLEIPYKDQVTVFSNGQEKVKTSVAT
jgi:antitoxin HicB